MMRTKFAVLVALLALFAWPASTGLLSCASADDQGAEHVDHDGEHGDHENGHDEHGGEDAAASQAAHGADDGHGDGAAHSNTNPLSVDPDLAIFTAIIFALLAVILRKFAWGPIRDAVEQREKRIADQLAEAQRSTDEARRLLNEHEAKLANTSEEVKAMMDDARRDAEHQKNRIVAEAEEAATAQKTRAVREIDAAKNLALEQLAQTSVDQAVGLAGRIVGHSLNKDDHGKLIQDALKQFPSDN